MNKLRQKSWYYALTVLLGGFVISTVIALVAIALGKTDLILALNIEAGSYVVGATLAFGVAGASLFEWIPAKVKARMKWLLGQPLAGQAAVWFFTGILVLSFIKVVRVNMATIWTASLDVGLNAAFTLFGIAVLYELIRVLFIVKN